MYFTYAHTKPDGTIFYIGKGNKRRVTDKSNRNRHWNFIVEKHGFEAIILGEFENEKDCLNEEAELIGHFKKFGTLCNILDSGEVNPMSNPEVAQRCADTKRAKGQYTGKEIEEYNAKYKERMENDSEFAANIKAKRQKARAVKYEKDCEKMKDTILQIRKLRNEGMKLKELAAMFGFSEPTICRISKGTSYACVAGY